jgi:ATP phosphoribosyltransferase
MKVEWTQGRPRPGAGLVLALPKGRILDDVLPLLHRAGIVPEPEFSDPQSRRLRFATSEPGLDLISVRNFDVATFVAFGAAELGIAGNDVLMEFDYSEIYAPLDLGVGHCRLVVAGIADQDTEQDKDDPLSGSPRPPELLSKGETPPLGGVSGLRAGGPLARGLGPRVGGWSHIRVATKYPEITRRHFAARGVQAECIKLNGAIELAPRLGLCRHIVDLVQTGATLRANGLVEIERIAEVSARLIVNRPALKTRPHQVGHWIERLRAAIRMPRTAEATAAGS